MDITQNPNNADSSIVNNKDLLVLLLSHLKYVESLRFNIFVKLAQHEVEFLDNKILKLKERIKYLKDKLGVEETSTIFINQLAH